MKRERLQDQIGFSPEQLEELAGEGFLRESGVTARQEEALLRRMEGETLQKIADDMKISIEAVRAHSLHAVRNIRDFERGRFDLSPEGKRKRGSWIKRQDRP